MDKNKFSFTKEVMKNSLPYIKGDLLDLGAGTGKYKPIFLPACSSYIGFDMFPGQNIDVVGDILDTKFDAGRFDAIVCTQVFEHIEKPWLATKEMNRLLKPGGVVVVTAPFLVSFHADPTDYFRYTKEGLSSLFINEGFEIIESDKYAGWPMFISEIIHQNFASPYRKNSRLRLKLMAWTEKFFLFFDRRLEANKVYCNSYVIARKK
jgi:SAM-dependent methyltransferase